MSPTFLNPFVLDIAEIPAERHGNVDLYLPAASGPRPAVVFIHGGPVPADRTPTPREWPVYVGYGRAIAARGAVGVMLDHRLHDMDACPTAAADVAAAIDVVRADPRVAADRIGLWFFSGGGLLSAVWLRSPAAWLRCVAATYPLLDVPSDAAVDGAYRPIDAVAGARDLPIIVSRVGHERPWIQAGVDTFIEAARSGGASLTVIDVPAGRHGFDHLDHTDESRTAVGRAIDLVLDAVDRPL
jgi:BD-FAE protein